MKCPELETLSADVDGEVPEHTASGLHSHIAGCKRCQAIRAQFLVLKGAIRSSVPSREAPSPDLLARIEALAARPAPRRAEKRLRIAAIALGACLALSAGIAVIWRGAAPTADSTLEAQLVGDHVLNALGHQKPIEIASEDPEVVERWFQSRLALAVKLPRVDGAKVAGGRLCSVAGRLTALTFIDWRDRRLSLFAMPSEGNEPQPPCAEGVRGFTVCRRRVQGVEYALVSDLPAHEATRFLGLGR